MGEHNHRRVSRRDSKPRSRAAGRRRSVGGAQDVRRHAHAEANGVGSRLNAVASATAASSSDARTGSLGRSRAELRRAQARRRRTRQVLLAVAVVALLLVVGVLGWGAWKYNRIAKNLTPSNTEDLEAVRTVVDPVVEKNDPLYFLILGADRRPGQTRARSDTVMIARVDPVTGSVSMLSIPRDMRVEIEGHGLDKLTHANAYGGPALAVKTVKAFTGLPINHYLEVDFEGFVSIVKIIGGVTIDVDVPINDPHGSDTGGVSNVTYIPAGRQTLNAEQALTFVRSRAFPDGDFTRIRHQQQFLIALMKQTLRRENLTRLPAIAEAAAEHIETDMKPAELLDLVQRLKGTSAGSIKAFTAPGTPGNIGGVSYVLPDTEACAVLFQQFRDGTAEPKK